MTPLLAHEGGVAADAPLVACLLAGAAYQASRQALRVRTPRSRALAPGRALATWSGLVTLVVAVSGPLHRWAEQTFAGHMVQHLLIGLLAPLLLVVGRPARVVALGWGALRRTGPPPTVRRARRGLRALRDATWVALLAVVAHVAGMATWHVPALYDAAVRSEAVHGLEHATMFLTGLVFWWVVVGAGWDERAGLSVVYLFLAGLPLGALAALLTLAPSPLYASQVAAGGTIRLEDQQLAGAIMWVPGGLLYLGLACALLVRWLGSGPAPGTRTVAWDA